MRTIALLMCGEHKLDSKSKAEDIYTSPRFKRDLRYAKTLTAEENIFILSAKHHLLRLKQEIEPYNQCLEDLTQTELDEWSNTVLAELKTFADFEYELFQRKAGNRDDVGIAGVSYGEKTIILRKS